MITSMVPRSLKQGITTERHASTNRECTNDRSPSTCSSSSRQPRVLTRSLPSIRSRRRDDCHVPFTCEACGGRTDLIPAVGDVLRCSHCADERPFARPPLLVVTGPAGVGKSTLCARLAGTIPEAALLDADILGEHHVSVVSPNPDYPAFWRPMMRL